MPKNLKYYLKKAQKEKWAIGQFNFSDPSQLEGIVEAAKDLESPIILGTSEGESRFLGLKQAVALKKSYQVEKGFPIFLNLDHGKSFEYLKKAIELGYDMVHFDGSKLSLKENISQTKEIVKYAKKFSVLVEGEVGAIGNESSKIYKEKFVIKPEDLTNPQEAAKYVRETRVDCLAVNIGSFHGVSVQGNPKLDLERLKQIKKAVYPVKSSKAGISPKAKLFNGVKNVFLVLHGGSGTPDRDVKKSIELGIRKININTELRMAYTETLKESFKVHPEEITPYKYLPNAIKAVQKVVEGKILLFGSKNKI